MFKKSKVLFKGKGSGLIVFLDEQSSYDEIKCELLDKVRKSKSFFIGASEDIIFEGKELTSEQENEIVDIIVNNSGMEVGFINVEADAIKKKPAPKPAPEEYDLNEAFAVPKSFSSLSTDDRVLIIHGFVRSGKLIEADENVIIVGGVNPGGEVFAGKNIIVFGQLKGKAVAGRNGDKQSFIASILMEPELLGIAGYVTRFPEEKKDKLSKTPSIARLESGKIVVSPAGAAGTAK